MVRYRDACGKVAERMQAASGLGISGYRDGVAKLRGKEAIGERSLLAVRNQNTVPEDTEWGTKVGPVLLCHLVGRLLKLSNFHSINVGLIQRFLHCIS